MVGSSGLAEMPRNVSQDGRRFGFSVKRVEKDVDNGFRLCIIVELSKAVTLSLPAEQRLRPLRSLTN
jgi:hypothetical protein